MPPLDRRLVRESRSARPHLLIAGALGVVSAGLIIAQAALLAHVIDRAAMHGASLDDVRPSLIALAVVLAGRALVAGGFELSGRVGAIRVMSELRGRLADHLLRVRPGGRPADQRTGDLATAAVQGVDALEAYLAGYLPQLVLATVVPVAILAWVVPIDPIGAGLLAITVPLLIVFMILIGKDTKEKTEARWQALSFLASHFLDIVRGLPTLTLHRRERAQAATLATVGERYRRETMATLRIAFLSALVLELFATIGTALVAASVGVSLAGGHMTLEVGLTVLLLAPELYGPLRQVGQQFHASADGLAAADRIFAVLDEPAALATRGGGVCAPDPTETPLRLERVSFEYPQRPGRVLAGFDLELAPGEMTAVIGPSGSGKSTIASLVMRLADPTDGTLTCGAIDLRDVDAEMWRRQVAWVPQHATIFSGTVADNIRLAAPGKSEAAVTRAAEAAGALDFIRSLPAGMQTRLGDGGRRLSAGQRQRIALARAFLRDAPLLVLDEPTANLDHENASAIGDAIERLARGRTTLLIAHDEALVARADAIVDLRTSAAGRRAAEAVAA